MNNWIAYNLKKQQKGFYHPKGLNKHFVHADVRPTSPVQYSGNEFQIISEKWYGKFNRGFWRVGPN